MELVKYSKEADVEEDVNDFEDLVAKHVELSKNSSDWKKGGCDICRFPRTPHQRIVAKRRLCTFFFMCLV